MVAGASGFIGKVLVSHLISKGHLVLGVDVLPSDFKASSYRHIIGDLTSPEFVRSIRVDLTLSGIFHLASEIDFAVRSQSQLYERNMQMTNSMIQIAKRLSCPHIVFVSSNSIFLGLEDASSIPFNKQPAPIDAYGRSKVASEDLLLEQDEFQTTIFRCPNVLGVGRAGMLSIFFDFVLEGRYCWLLGDGSNRYQCIYVDDLVSALLSGMILSRSGVFNVGASRFETVRDMYQSVIDFAQTGAEIREVPARLGVSALQILNKFGVSPLGPYQFRMLTSDFSFDISHASSTLGWKPHVSNNEMLLKAFESYRFDHASMGNSANSRRINPFL